VARFAAFEIGEKDKAARVETFQQNRAQERLSGGANGGQAHRVGLGELRADSVVQPCFKLRDGFRAQIFAPQSLGLSEAMANFVY
jgi:hypothetical protein